MFEKNIVIFIPSFLEAEKIFNITDFQNFSHFSTGMYAGFPVVVTGACKTNAAIASSLFFANNQVKYPLLTGICGAYEESGLNIGDVVCITKDYLVDECNYNGNKITTLHEKGFLKEQEYCAEFSYFNEFKEVSSNTVSVVPHIKSIADLYMKKTKALVENMEGASFGIAANKFNIKPYQIRAVSNYSSSLEKQQWDIKKATKNLKNAVDTFINFFSQ